MKMMEVCFVGIGSIAKRHILNLKRIAEKRDINLAIDAIRRSKSNNDEIETLGIRNVYCNYEEVQCVYDIVFITNPTKLHLESIKKMKTFGKYFFVEKPISALEQIEEVEAVLKQDSLRYYVACPLRYNAVIQYIKHNVNLESVISVRSISSSYLPDWRPGVDYKSTYSAQRDL